MGRGLCSSTLPLLHVLLLQCFVLYRSHAAPDISSVLNHNDLKKVMVHSLGPEGDACVRLLHRSGYIGCARQDSLVGDDAGIEGPLFPVKSLKSIDFIPNGAVAVVSANLAGQFLLQAASNRTLQVSLAGILIQHSKTFPGWNEASKNGYMKPKHADPAKESFDSSDETEKESYHVWNPAGLNLVSLSFPFPVFLLDNVTSSLAISQAEDNTVTDPESAAISLSSSGPKHMARMHLNMEASTNSSVCLQERTCLPLGGFSVASALPPLAASHQLAYDSPENSSSIWVVSSVDSTALFHRQTKGADAPLSGLVAMLAAARILGSSYRKQNSMDAFDPLDVDSNKRRRIVFAAVMGEPWGNMGSRRLLWESSIGSPSLLGLNISSAEALIEVGQVGRALQWNIGGDASPESSTMSSDTGSVMRLYLHTGSMKKQSMQDRTRGVDALKRAFIDAGRESVSSDRFEISDASAGLEFPPPGIAEAFLKVRPELPALAITEFNASFLNEAYSSTFDTLKSIDVASIVSCAEVLARSLHSLMLMPSTPPSDRAEDAMAPASSPGLDTKSPLDINTTALEYYVKSLVECLIAPEPGLSCDLASRLMTPSAGPAQRSNYVGILRSVRQDPQIPDPNLQSDMERFLFSYMAFATSPDVSDAFDEDLDVSASFARSGNATSPATEQHHEEISIPHTKTDAELRTVLGQSIDMPNLVVRDRMWCTIANATMCPSGTVCAGYRDVKGQKGYGICMHATVRYVPAYSTAFHCQGCNGTDAWGAFNWTVTADAELWEQQFGWPKDPMWTESNWPSGTPSVELYLKDSDTMEAALFGIGLAMTVLSILISLSTNFLWYRREKED